jgi:DNA-binding Lrp family transcriptional regulator
MVQKTRLTVLAAFGKAPISISDIMRETMLTKAKVRFYRKKLFDEGLIEQVGVRDLERGFGSEALWDLVKAKPKAINAFDWRNWETQCHTSKREQAYSVSQFERRHDGRVIVYSKA